ncbi:MAG: hypothetical protein JWO86_4152 [Myxococcaceae bacterium]|nr:hypothetical protein [Myxococcaceae bacterium]
MSRTSRASIASIASATSAMLLAFAAPAAAADPVAAPLPSKDVRWSLALGGAVDVGALPHPAPGVALGFDVRRGALGFHAVTSAFLPQAEQNVSVGLFDLLSTICALAPLGARFDLGACGGIGAGVQRNTVRPEGVALTRFDVTLVPGLLLSLDAGTVIDPLRTAAGAASRSSLFAFRGSLGVLVRLW